MVFHKKWSTEVFVRLEQEAILWLTPLTQLRASQDSFKLLELLRAATGKNRDTASSQSHSRSRRDHRHLGWAGHGVRLLRPKASLRISNGIGFEVARRWALSQAQTYPTLSPTTYSCCYSISKTRIVLSSCHLLQDPELPRPPAQA